MPAINQGFPSSSWRLRWVSDDQPASAPSPAPWGAQPKYAIPRSPATTAAYNIAGAPAGWGTRPFAAGQQTPARPAARNMFIQPEEALAEAGGKPAQGLLSVAPQWGAQPAQPAPVTASRPGVTPGWPYQPQQMGSSALLGRGWPGAAIASSAPAGPTANQIGIRSLADTGAILSPQQRMQYDPTTSPQRAQLETDTQSIRAHNLAWAGEGKPSGVMDQRAQTPWMPPRSQQSLADISGNANLMNATAQARAAQQADQLAQQQRDTARNVTWGAGAQAPRTMQASLGNPTAWADFLRSQTAAMDAAKQGDAEGFNASRAQWRGSKDNRPTVPVNAAKQSETATKRAATQAERQRYVMAQRQGANPWDVRMNDEAQRQTRDLAMQEMEMKRQNAAMQSFAMALAGAYGGQVPPAAGFAQQISPYFTGQWPGAGAPAAPQPWSSPLTQDSLTKAGAALRALPDGASEAMQRSLLAGMNVTDPQIQAEMIATEATRRGVNARNIARATNAPQNVLSRSGGPSSFGGNMAAINSW